MTALDYTRPQPLHRPTDPSAMGAEIRRLRATGLTPRDLSMALHLDLAAVLEALRAKSPAEEKS